MIPQKIPQKYWLCQLTFLPPRDIPVLWQWNLHTLHSPANPQGNGRRTNAAAKKGNTGKKGEELFYWKISYLVIEREQTT